jgi:hypothetical protein
MRIIRKSKTCKFADFLLRKILNKVSHFLSNFFEGQKLFDGTPFTGLKINKSRGVGCPIFLSNYIIIGGGGIRTPGGP